MYRQQPLAKSILYLKKLIMINLKTHTGNVMFEYNKAFFVVCVCREKLDCLVTDHKCHIQLDVTDIP